MVADECAQGYVLRLVRGSGVVKYLQHTDSSASLRATDYFETNLGERFAVVDESTFTDAFFAFEPGDMYRLCETLPDEASFAASAVAPAPNCSVMSYDVRGTPHQIKRYLPDQDTCGVVAQSFCQSTPGHIRCAASFAGAMLELPPTPNASASTAPASTAAAAPAAEAAAPAVSPSSMPRVEGR